MAEQFFISPATFNEDALLADHYIRLWESYGHARSEHLHDALGRVTAFIDYARLEHEFAGFLCRVKETVIGSACCQIRRSPYPEILKPEIRKVGYIWSVFVEPTHRRQGVAAKLMTACIDHLRDIGCTAINLHSSEQGMPLYRKFGFEPAAEMRLTLEEGR